MRIHPTQNYQYNQKNPQFKSAFPVVHWVAESNGSYAPAVSLHLTKKLQKILLGVLNQTSRKDQGSVAEKVRKYLAETDKSYRGKQISRSFYDKRENADNGFAPLVYLITGDDVDTFNSKFGEEIGRSKSYSPYINGVRSSAELNRARRDYYLLGLDFILKKGRRMFDKSGMEYGLHTKFQTIRSKTGKVKGYQLIDCKFCPQQGPNNPFVRVGLVREQ